MFRERVDLYRQLEENRDSRVIAYITGDRRQLETKIHSEALDFFIHHLDNIGNVNRLSLIL